MDRVWPLVEPWIGAVCERSRGRYTPESLKALAERGSAQLWIAGAADAVAMTELVKYPAALALRAFIATGRGREGWQHHRHAIAAWGKTQGATLFEAFARPGWERVFPEMTRTHLFLEKEL